MLLGVSVVLSSLHVAVAQDLPREVVALEKSSDVYLCKIGSPEKVCGCVLVERVNGMKRARFTWSSEGEESAVL